MSSRLYVEGFPSSLSEEDLANLFSTFGMVVSAVIARTTEKDSMCFAEVEMVDSVEAEKAIQVLHRTLIDGKRIFVFHDVWQDSTTGRLS